MSLQDTLNFLSELAVNNNKAWFDEHRKAYQVARSAFEGLIADVITHFDPVMNLGGVTPKETMFRINRDVRFSKDKSPYKLNMGASLARGGRKGEGRSYYLQIQPGESMVACGLYEPDKAALDNLRQHLGADAEPFREIIAAPDFARYFGGLYGETLKVAPAGYDRDHPAIDLLRYKQFLAVHRISDSEVVKDDLVPHIVRVCAAMTPFLGYLEQASSAPPETTRLDGRLNT